MVAKWGFLRPGNARYLSSNAGEASSLLRVTSEAPTITSGAAALRCESSHAVSAAKSERSSVEAVNVAAAAATAAKPSP
jgi:hypothetical protein